MKQCEECGNSFYDPKHPDRKLCGTACRNLAVGRANTRVIAEPGTEFEWLTVVRHIGKNRHNHQVYLCRCLCGKEIEVLKNSLITGARKSCGCKPKAPRDTSHIVWRSSKVEKVCEACNRTYKVPPSRNATTKYCSSECKRNSSSTAVAAPGDRFGRLLVLSVDLRATPAVKVTARCECGTVKDYVRYDVVTGKTSSCGCLRNEKIGTVRRSHGASSTAEYVAYQSALDRCTREKNTAYKNYGGRGIQFKFSSFEEFFAELGPKPSPQHSVDRINNEGHYERGNVRWATRIQQANNRRKSIVPKRGLRKKPT